jgi:SAM-dependent methyltransferase
VSASRRDHFDEIWRLKLAAPNDSTGIRGNLRAINALERLSAGDALLDVGCGNGTFGEAASGQFREVHGVDIADAAVRFARERGIRAQVLDVGSEVLPYPDNAFDAVTALSMLQYVVDVEHVLRECRRVLRPCGQFIACVPNMRAVWRIWELAVSGGFPRTSLDVVGVDGGTVHYFTSRSMSELTSRAGFDVAGRCGVFCVPRWLESRAAAGPLGFLKREFFSAEVLLDMRVR